MLVGSTLPKLGLSSPFLLWLGETVFGTKFIRAIKRKSNVALPLKGLPSEHAIPKILSSSGPRVESDTQTSLHLRNQPQTGQLDELSGAARVQTFNATWQNSSHFPYSKLTLDASPPTATSMRSRDYSIAIFSFPRTFGINRMLSLSLYRTDVLISGKLNDSRIAPTEIGTIRST